MIPVATSDMNEQQIEKLKQDNMLVLEITKKGFVLWHSGRWLIDASELSERSNFTVASDERITKYSDITRKAKKKKADMPVCCSCHKDRIYFDVNKEEKRLQPVTATTDRRDNQ